jgi:dTDP-glucose 4,6-dehydratase
MPTVLITGGLGFIGAAFVNYMVREGHYDVVVVIDKESHAARRSRIDEDREVKLLIANVADRSALEIALRDCLLVVNFAAESHVDSANGDPAGVIDDNVASALVLFTECAKRGIRCLHISTDEVYGDSDASYEGKREDDALLVPTNMYSASKAATEMFFTACRFSHKLKGAVVRLNNVYGPGQHEEKFIPRIIDRLRRGDTVTLAGDGEQLRCYCHVDDAVEAVWFVARNATFEGDVYNICAPASNELSCRAVGRLLCGAICPQEPFESKIEYVPDRLYNDRRYLMDGTKLKMLGWESRISFLEGLRSMLTDDEQRNLRPQE